MNALNFFSEKIITAKKDHICTECGNIIKKGNPYEYVIGKWGADFEIYKTCKTCRNIRKDLSNLLTHHAKSFTPILMLRTKRANTVKIAQLVERSTDNRIVVSSILTL